MDGPAQECEGSLRGEMGAHAWKTSTGTVCVLADCVVRRHCLSMDLRKRRRPLSFVSLSHVSPLCCYTFVLPWKQSKFSPRSVTAKVHTNSVTVAPEPG